MTVITKPLTENKSKKLKEPLFPAGNVNAAARADVEAGGEPRFVVLGGREHRNSTAVTICLFLTALLVMSIGIMGGMYVYRQFARSQTHFHGWCNIPYKVQQSRQESHISGVPDYEIFGFGKNDELESMKQTFKEEFKIDLENESFEEIVVPDFGRGRRGRFIHDFSKNKTGIVDLNGHRCFVMPLNRDRVLPPLSMYDLVTKLSRGDYVVDTEIVRETMKVVTPPITDFTDIGQFIEEECKSRKTYLLEKDDSVKVWKRSVPTSETVFAEFAGNKISELFIDTSVLDEAEMQETAAKV